MQAICGLAEALRAAIADSELEMECLILVELSDTHGEADSGQKFDKIRTVGFAEATVVQLPHLRCNRFVSDQFSIWRLIRSFRDFC
jgi:hypothetical protein